VYDSPAKIASTVWNMVGQPETELLQQSDLLLVVFERLSLYYEGARASDQNIASKKTVEFTLVGSESSVDLTDYTDGDIIVPLWCEVKIFDYAGMNPVWQYVPTVNMDTLPERRRENILAVGYHGENPTQLTAEFSVYGNESVLPYNTFRIWYTPQNVFSSDINATVSIPDNLLALIVVDSALNVIPTIQLNAAKYADKRPELALRMATLDKASQRFEIKKQEWLEWWEAFRIQSRSYHRAVDHNDVLTGQLGRGTWGWGSRGR